VRPTAFLDRDGTINVKAPEGEYVTSWDGFAFLPGAEQAIRLLADAGWRVVVVTNQRGVALGRMTMADVDDIHRRMREAVPLDGVYVCPHERDTCDCRKPGTGLFRQAMRDDPGIDPGSSVVIGDSESDIRAGRAFGARTIKVGAPPLPSLLDAATRLTSSAG
jgi:D-glycero-D-manno-heptose 1,7-bisphosphate phosphatase